MFNFAFPILRHAVSFFDIRILYVFLFLFIVGVLVHGFAR